MGKLWLGGCIQPFRCFNLVLELLPGSGDRGLLYAALLRVLPPPQELPSQLLLANKQGQWELQGQRLQMGQGAELPGLASA